MSGKAYSERRRNENIAESKKQVADALESMAGSVQAQDAAIRDIGRIAKAAVNDMKHSADKAKADASEAIDDAHAAKMAAARISQDLQDFRDGQTVLQKFQWLFRGSWW